MGIVGRSKLWMESLCGLLLLPLARTQAVSFAAARTEEVGSIALALVRDNTIYSSAVQADHTWFVRFSHSRLRCQGYV